MFRKCFSGAVVAGILTAVGLVGQPMASADELPSGQRTVSGTTVEPAYNAATGTIIYLSTTHAPVDSTMTVAPLYMPVYPVGAQEDALNCQHGPDNCPDHGPLIAGLAAHVMPGTYGGGVAGHDHLLAATGANFNGACEPVVVLFTSAEAAANEHLTTESAVNDAVDNHVAIEIPLKAATFSCTRVSAAVYQQGLPVPPVP